MYPWIREHDERWSFLVPYLVLSVVLGVFVSLFWLLALILFHGWLEWHRKALRIERPAERIGWVAWELKLDFALLLLAFVIEVYTDAVFALLGAGIAARFGLQAMARITAWQRVIRGVLLTFDEGLIAARNAMRMVSRAPDAQAEHAQTREDTPPWRRPFGLGDHAGLWLSFIALALLCAAPMLLPMSTVEVLRAIVAELHPWPR